MKKPGRRFGLRGNRGADDFGGGWSTRPPKGAPVRRGPPAPRRPLMEGGPECAAPAPGDRARRRLPYGLILLYEDMDLLVIDKPSGLLSVATGAVKDRTAYWVLSEYLRKRGEKRRAAAVHRLDRDTSGLMVFAKSEITKRRLMEGWNDTVLERRYVALVEGILDGAEGLIDAPLGEDRAGNVEVSSGGLPARTRWRRIGEGGGYTLLELELETGRRNQIRAHLTYLGKPVAGDAKYGARTDPVGRLALHAESLSFYHPRDARVLHFVVPAPPTFRNALSPSKGK